MRYPWIFGLPRFETKGVKAYSFSRSFFHRRWGFKAMSGGQLIVDFQGDLKRMTIRVSPAEDAHADIPVLLALGWSWVIRMDD